MATGAEGKAQLHVVENVRLEEFERAVYAGDMEQAGSLLLLNLRRLKSGADFVGHSTDPRLKRHLYTRFCAAVVALLANPKFGFSKEGFEHVAAEHATVDALFRASSFGSSDHLLPLVAAPDGVGELKASGPALAKFLVAYSLRSALQMDFEDTFAKAPQELFPLWAGMCSPLLTVSEQASQRRELLLGLHGLFRGCTASPGMLPALSDAYMYSSYALASGKHDMKGTVHEVLLRSLEAAGVALPKPKNIRVRRNYALRMLQAGRGLIDAPRPTAVVCLEWFGGNHSMFRCYAAAVRQLRKRFRLVAFSRAADIDEVGKAEFDEWREVPTVGLSFQKLVRDVLSVRPDLIYYPSLGMAMWWVVLASARLAPVQLMTLGHPASSRSPNMDYVVCERGSVGDDQLFTERIVEVPESSMRFVPRGDAELPPPDPDHEAAPGIVRIAVPAMLCKLSPAFMGAARAVQERCETAGQRVEFHFFVNMVGVNLHQSASEIREWLPSAKVYERADYVTYANHLRRCHMHLSTFPFGGTNSNLDSLLLGLPVVTMVGAEPHSRFDAVMVHKAFDDGDAEFLVAKTKDDLVDLASRLATDHRLRNELRRRLLSQDLRAKFMAGKDGQEHFVDAVWLVYKSHEALQNGPRRIYAPDIVGNEDRKEL